MIAEGFITKYQFADLKFILNMTTALFITLYLMRSFSLLHNRDGRTTYNIEPECNS